VSGLGTQEQATLLIQMIADAFEREYKYTPPQMRVASALMGKKIGQNAAPYNFVGRMMAVNLALKNPEMKDDPTVKRHFDWVDEYWEGKAKSDKVYASFSRSLKILLENGFITSDWYIKSTGEKIRHRRARYLITDKGKKTLPPGG